ncbi:MAG: 1-deoxy-D-xylulose-5-phosphate reductoisomerase [Coriobacteriales bacterium]|nr:1-deoxy-D-xylulose-5-phosphate reductoisomerase [Coriobacteriales bacterium]
MAEKTMGMAAAPEVAEVAEVAMGTGALVSQGDAPLRLVLLGSTGSIGRQALDVVRQNLVSINVVALATHRNIELLVAQALEFAVSAVAIGDETLRNHPLLGQLPAGVRVGFGAAAVEALCVSEGVDMVLNALVGAAGLRASYTTLAQGRRLALANKESLVVGGELLMGMLSSAGNTNASGNASAPGAALVSASGAAPANAPLPALVPVDSEHSAIFQCLVGERAEEASRIWLTASGGPFRGWTRAQLKRVTAREALAHPTWLMGPKISIDSATLMNKGLEVIEAHHLFAFAYDDIRVVVHPQSCVHSMVEYRDGSVKAHLGTADMRIPIQYAFSYPRRWEASLEPVDFVKLGHLGFEEPDIETFGALGLALAAGRTGGTTPAALNAANEVAVQSFLAGECAFLDIERVVETVLERHESEPVASLEQLEEVDAWARAAARAALS